MPASCSEALSDLNAFGEDTIVARRHWVLDGDELFPVVMGESEE
jgi:hypothetical protein